MDFNATIDLIIKDLEEARKIIDDLKKYPGVPVLQVELAKSKCKSAGEVISMLKEVNINESERAEEKPQIEIKPVAESKAETKSEQLEEVKQVKPEEIRSEPLTPVADVKVEEKKKIVRQDQTPVKEVEPVSDEIIEESGILADSFSHLSNRFNEQIGNIRNDDISGKIKSMPITNLSEAIGLNDKFLFMKDIFSGDKEAYSQAIARLEESTSIADAKAVIMSYTGNNTENEAVKQLIDLVKRKLPADE